MRSFLATLIILFACQFIFAGSTGKISGKITDKQTGDPLMSANILLQGTSIGATADFDGKYSLKDIKPGSYKMIVTYIGYKPDTVENVKVKKGSETIVNVEMIPEAITSKTIEITAQAQGQLSAINQQLSSNSIKNTVSAERIRESPDANSASAPSRPSSNSAPSNGNLQRLNSPNNQVIVNGTTYYNSEEYQNIIENDFHYATKDPLSTFSIDVDAASYSNLRRFLDQGQFPPKDAVRIEEMINYFKYDYPQPKGDHPFSITTEVSQCPWNKSNKLVLVGLQGKKVDTEDLPPANLVFLLDVSGSMADANKLPLVKAAFKLLVKQLRDDDRVAIVTYASTTGIALESTSGDEKEKILNAIDQLQAGGSTAGGEGIQLAYRVAKENFLKHGNNRVILATDGDFNVGVSNTPDLIRMIEEKREKGIFLSILGFGMGNIKDSRLEQLADKGNGNYGYVDNILEAKKVFVEQMAGTLFTIAKDVKIQIEFNPVNVKAYRLIGYENRVLDKEDFNDDRKDAGELGAGHTVTALYEVVPADGNGYLPEVDPLKYQDEVQVRVNKNAKYGDELLTVKFRYKEPDENESKLITKVLKDENTRTMSNNLTFASAVAEFGLLLRDSRFKGDASFSNVLDRAKKAKGEDEEGYRAEFIKMVEMCNLMAEK